MQVISRKDIADISSLLRERKNCGQLQLRCKSLSIDVQKSSEAVGKPTAPLAVRMGRKIMEKEREREEEVRRRP